MKQGENSGKGIDQLRKTLKSKLKKGYGPSSNTSSPKKQNLMKI